MKKIVVLILAFLYLTATVGATVHLHYCMDKLVDWGLGRNENDKCSKCGMEKSQERENGCCKDEHKHVKLETDHKGATTYFLTELISFTSPSPGNVFELQDILPTVTEQNPLSHAPPRGSDLAVYIRNCVFRI